MSADTRLKLGVSLLILGLVMPAGTLAVVATEWPVPVKGTSNNTRFRRFLP